MANQKEPQKPASTPQKIEKPVAPKDPPRLPTSDDYRKANASFPTGPAAPPPESFQKPTTPKPADEKK